MVTVKRALLSCHDKTGLDGFAKELSALGIELIASGGTAEFLTARGLAVKTLEAFAGITEQLDGRVKTLHPKIHAGILARRDDPAHVQAVGSDGLIDLLVVNLYPFAQAIQRPGVSLQDAIEQIDVGGVALLRAAAKNFAHVAVVSSPQQYSAVTEALRKGRGTLPDALSRQLATAAFQVTSGYDGAITQFLSSDGGTHQAANARAEAVFPDSATLQLRKQQMLRYGENPHQHGAWYVPAVGQAWGLGTLRHLQGKELSYNNLLDIDATMRCLLEFQDSTCAIIKHHAPCGVATAASLSDAYERAHACDAESAFGGVVGLNRPLDDLALAARLTEAFLEVIVAPAVAPQALERLGKKPNVRVVAVTWPSSGPGTAEWRQLLGSWLLQQPDREPGTEGAWPVATARSPSPTERRDLLFAWKAAKHALSNGIAIAKDQATVGLGQGQPSRVGSVRLAIQQAGGRAKGAVAASDGFFPFPDSVELLAQAGVTAVIQPGGSIRDADVIAAANRMNVAMVMTGVRHFRH